MMESREGDARQTIEAELRDNRVRQECRREFARRRMTMQKLLQNSIDYQARQEKP